MEFRTLTRCICKHAGLTIGYFLRIFYVGIDAKIKSGQNYPNPFSHYCTPGSSHHQFQATAGCALDPIQVQNPEVHWARSAFAYYHRALDPKQTSPVSHLLNDNLESLLSIDEAMHI